MKDLIFQPDGACCSEFGFLYFRFTVQRTLLTLISIQKTMISLLMNSQTGMYTSEIAAPME